MIVDLTSISLEKTVVHKVGNKVRNEGTHTSKELLSVNDENLKEILLKYFLSSFSFNVSYNFTHNVDLNFNEVFTYANTIFENNEIFLDQSINILNHLYQKSTHPKIKEGEFYMTYMKNCLVNGFTVDAVGIFKSENKDVYLKVNQKMNSEFEINYDRGVNVNKLDKGCIIFNTGAQNGFTVFSVDAASKSSSEAQYWKEDFLNIKTIQNDSFQTDTFLKICNEFSEKLPQNIDNVHLEKKVDFINKAINYFSNETEFNERMFEEHVLIEPEYVASFQEYKRTYEEKHELKPLLKFNISEPTVRKAKKNFKNLIKLDTNIQIKLEKSEDLRYLERGYDEEKRMHYYKVFFNNEK